MRGAAEREVLLEQPGWAVSGPVYQAGGDIHIHGRESDSQTPADRWKVWVGMVVVVLTAATLVKHFIFNAPPSATVRPGPASTPVQPAVPVSRPHLWDRHGRVRRPYSGGEGGIAGLFGLNRHAARWRLLTPGPWTNELVRLSITKNGFRPLSEYFPVRREVRVVLRRQ